MIELRGKYNSAKVFTEQIDQASISQIVTLLNQPFVENCQIRLMPDVHAGAGCVIGFTANLGDMVIPNIVGVDIGCGMLTVELGKVEIDYEMLDKVIRDYVPSGMNVHSSNNVVFNKMRDLYCYNQLKNITHLEKSLGTLGGGNHFIEIDVDDEGNKYLIIHTGSRNLGKQVADYYQKLAIEMNKKKLNIENIKQELIKKYKSQNREKEIEFAIQQIKQQNTFKVPKELAYLIDENRELYLHDMKLCQEFAVENRKHIANIILEKMNLVEQNRFETIHNYIEFDSNIIRKGAISAKEGEQILIPMNMRDGCIIGIGKGNKDWNYSAPHGAGRVMSRSQAKQQVNLEDFEKSMKGIYTTSVNSSTIDESPMVYKSMEDIVNNIKPSVDIVKIIKPVYNFKSGD